MDTEKKVDYFFKLLPSVLTLLAVVVGLYQFNKGQRANIESRDYQFNMQILSKFKETQQKIYSETMSVVAFLSSDTAYTSQKYKDNLTRFKQLYWVELTPVQSKGVEIALIKFWTDFRNLEMNKFKVNASGKEIDLTEDASALSDSIKISIMDWTLPGGLTGLNSSLVRKKE